MSFVGDILGISNKPEKAAAAAGDAQVRAAEIGANTIREQNQQYREDSAPYVQAGNQGLSALLSGMLGGAPSQGTDKRIYGNKGENPQYGRPAGGAQGGYQNSDLLGSYGYNDFTNRPDYQFRLQRGMDGIESSAAAKGSLFSGATLKGLNEFNRGVFDQQFANERANFQNEQANRYTRLFDLARLGQNAVAQTGASGASAASNIASLQNSMGQSQAGAILGANQARQQRYANIGNLLGTATGFGGFG